jgi:hypothetical protein
MITRYSQLKYCALVTVESRDNEVIAMITKLVSNDNSKSFKLHYTIYFLKIQNDDDIK